MEEKKEKLPQPSMSLKLKILQSEYEIKLLNNGQRIDIENKKATLSQGMLGNYLTTASGVEAFALVDMVAVFTVLLPDLIKGMSYQSLLELDPIQTRPFMRAYQKYYDWDQAWRNYLNQSIDEEPDDK